jgi:hypothetical protein
MAAHARYAPSEGQGGAQLIVLMCMLCCLCAISLPYYITGIVFAVKDRNENLPMTLCGKDNTWAFTLALLTIVYPVSKG